MIACGGCGKENEDYYRFCLACGTPLVQRAAAAPSSAMTASPSRKSSGESSLDEEEWFVTDPSLPPHSWDEAGGAGPVGGAHPAAGERRGAAAAAGAHPVGGERRSPVDAPSPQFSVAPEAISVPAPPARGEGRRGASAASAPRTGTAALPLLGGAPLSPGPDGPMASAPAASPIAATGPRVAGPAMPRVAAGIARSAGEAMVGGEIRTCPTCGNDVPASFRFCGRCGARVGEAASRTLYLDPSAEVVEEKFHGRLVFVRPDGSTADSMVLNADETLVGRDVGGRFASDRLLSPRHGTFLYRDNRLYVRDEASLNGIFLRLRGERELGSGDVFRIGQQLLCYEAGHGLEVILSVPDGDDTYLLGSPDLGYWGRLRQLVSSTVSGNIFLLSGPEVTLGRERAHITFPYDGFVSATHAALAHRGERTVLNDRGSSNGTYIKVQGEVVLQHGDILLMGQQLLRIELQR